MRFCGFQNVSINLPQCALRAGRGNIEGTERELDAMLVERAIAAGATFLPGFRAMEPIWSSGRVAGLGGVCHGSATAVKADVTIVATGARLHLLRALGLCDPAPPFTVGVRQYLRLPTDAFPGSYLRVYLEPNLLPDYAWVFPIDDRLVNVGLASAGHWRVQGKNSLTALLGTFVGGTSAAAGSLAGAVPVGPPTGAPLRADFLRRKTCAAGVLVAGEAAGLVDPLTGEGISFALQSGELAAEVAYRATLAHEFERALCTYGRALRQRFAAYFCFAWQLRSRLSDPRLANALVTLAAQLKQVRTSGWVSPTAPQALRSVLRSLPVLGLSPYLAYRMMDIRSHRIEL
jgi:flavin-dependent dehydrogenase